MVVKNLLMIPANSVAGIFMLIVACSLVISSTSETNSIITSTIAPNIPHKDTVDSSNNPLDWAINKLEGVFNYIVPTPNDKYSGEYFCMKRAIFNDLTICECLRKKLNCSEINLSHRNLSTLLNDTFAHFDNLKELDLSYNQLFFFGSGTFNLSNLQRLDLKYNNITILSPDTFKGLGKLEILYLSSNRMNYVFPGTFNNLSNLKILKLNENYLTSLSYDTFTGLNKLEVLNLADNQLRHIDSTTFNGLSNLKELWLSNNRLLELPKKIFTGLKNLTELSMSHNQLFYFDPNIFDNLPKLDKVYINHNELDIDLKNELKNKYNFKIFEL